MMSSQNKEKLEDAQNKLADKIKQISHLERSLMEI